MGGMAIPYTIYDLTFSGLRTLQYSLYRVKMFSKIITLECYFYVLMTNRNT